MNHAPNFLHFKHIDHAHVTSGVPVSAMLQCRENISDGDFFILYQSKSDGGFYVRKQKEFMTKFIAVTGDERAEWTHREKGGRYLVVGVFAYKADYSYPMPVDGDEMKVFYITQNGGKDRMGLVMTDRQFKATYTPVYKYAAEYVMPLGIRHEDIRKPVHVQINIKTPDADTFKASHRQNFVKMYEKAIGQRSAFMDHLRFGGSIKDDLAQRSHVTVEVLPKENDMYRVRLTKAGKPPITVMGKDRAEALAAAGELIW